MTRELCGLGELYSVGILRVLLAERERQAAQRAFVARLLMRLGTQPCGSELARTYNALFTRGHRKVSAAQVKRRVLALFDEKGGAE